ncbi:uncharacterized protein LOC134333510 [Trichomycterus rosablanca]|uniref:uncharacterized protein LOC134333510 n=1 Tax=Trichomycterus rosablanca TaxID=2290929 RepID=UPI002F3525D4
MGQIVESSGSPGSTNADHCTSVTSEGLQVASSKLTDSVLDETEATSGKQEDNLKSTRSNWRSKLQPALKFLVHLNIKNRNPIVRKIPKEELPAEAPAEEPTSPTEKKIKKDQMSTNAPLSENVNEDVECTDPCTSATSEGLQVASSKLTNSVLNETEGTSGKQEENLKSTRSDWKSKFQPALKYLVHLNIKNRNPIVCKIPKEELPAEAPAEEPTSTTEKKKKDQILAFFRRSWRTMKRIFTKRSNKISPA